jgi:hypothetical protein
MAGWLLACWLVLPVLLAFVVAQVRPSFLPRYVMGCFPAAVLLASRGLLRFRQSRPRAAWLLLALTLGVWAKIDTEFYRLHTKQNWRGVAQRLARQGRTGDIVVFYPPWNKVPYDYYAQGYVGLPTYSPPRPQGRATVSVACRPFLTGHSRVWLVVSPARRWFDPRGKLLRCLELHGRRSGRWEYSGVTLQLYSVEGAAGGRRQPQAAVPH